MRALLLLLALVVVNVPAAHQEWTDHRVAGEGRAVAATVLHARTVQGRHLVDYRLPEEVDPGRRRYSARVDDDTFARVEDADRLLVRVIPGEPGAHRPEGEVTSPVLVVVAAGADLITLLLVGLWWARRRHPAQGAAPTA